MRILISKFFGVLIALFFSSIILTLFSKTHSLIIFRPLDFALLPFLSPIVIFFGLLIIDYWLIFFLDRETSVEEKPVKLKMKMGYLYYFLIFNVGALVIYVIQWLYEKSAISFRVDALFSTTVSDLMWFVIFLSVFLTFLLFSFAIYTTINRLGLNLKTRIIAVLSNLFFFILMVTVNKLQVPVFPIFLSFLIFIFVLDIYSEKQRLNSSWIFTFIIVISGFTSLTIFSIYNKTVNNSRILSLKERIFSRNFEIEKAIMNLDNADSLDGLADICVADSNYTSEGSFIKRLNSGYLKISDSVYFNPLNGDYIKQLSNNDEEGRLDWVCFYNKSGNKNVFLHSNSQKIIVFHKDQVLFNNTEFNKIPVDTVEPDDTGISQYVKGGYSYIKFSPGEDIDVMSIQRIPDFLRPLSLFSLLFALTGFFVFLISILNSWFEFLPESLKITFRGVRTLKNRIQVSIIGLFVISFLSIGIIAFYYIKNLSINYQKDGANIVAAKMDTETKLNTEYSTEQGLLDLLNSKEKEDREYFYLYTREGNILDDARRSSYGNDFFPLKRLEIDEVSHENRVIQEILYIDGRDLMTTVFPINVGEENYLVCGYNMEDKLYSSTASNILSNFLNIYVFLFLLSGAIAIALANSISKPVEKLSEKLNVLNLNEKNETLEWKNNDEIGQLITIYNSAIKKLEESRKIIAKIERDSAWREMAKQVAHEIKNPLTPLKLNIQYLQGIVKNFPERAGETVKQIAPGLIDQINNLDKIATEFSDFAKMPQARNEKINLNEIVTVVHDFFRKREDLSIKLYVPINDLFVFADKNHIVSILNNIIKNAIQAIPTEKAGKIVIDLFKDEENAIVKITDNGTGIPEEMIDKVFSPNFTTKSSGTGLGLAISTNMIQAFNGKIYFTTKIDEGTSFFVEIPLMRIKDNYKEQNVVSLDD